MSGPGVVAVAGHLCVDVTPELGEAPGLEPGRLYEVGAARLTLGGCVANTALALHAAGVPTRVSATVGDDPLGEIARRLLAEQGIGAEGIATAAGAATSYSLVFQPRGQDRTFWHHAGANAAFTGREVDLDGIDVLHVGYPPLLPALLTDDAEPLLQLLAGGSAPGYHHLPRPGGGRSVAPRSRSWTGGGSSRGSCRTSTSPPPASTT